jgi:transposase
VGPGGSVAFELFTGIPIVKVESDLDVNHSLHPVYVISRDRGGIYADGATRGAPQALQVADRFHWLCNLSSAVERVPEQKRRSAPPWRRQLCP